MAARKINIKKRWVRRTKRLTLELLVVFLGVTAGFLLNNWQEGLREQTLEKKYVEGLLRDADANIKSTQESVDSDSLWLAKVDHLMALVHKGASADVRDSARAIGLKIQSISRLGIYRGTYEDLLHSGNLNLIRDFDVRGQIVEHAMQVQEVLDLDEFVNRSFWDYTLPFIMNTFDLREMQVRRKTNLEIESLTNNLLLQFPCGSSVVRNISTF